MTPRLVGLTGYARSGKDTAAQALVDRGWTRMAFADPVREALLALDPIAAIGTPCNLSWFVSRFGWEGAKEYPEVPRLLQRMSAEAGRDIHGADLWVEHMERRLMAADREHPENTRRPIAPTVITDVRYANEAELIRNYGGIVVRVDRPGTGPANDHPSEALDLEPDAVIVNDGTVTDLHAKVLALAGVTA